MPTTAPSPGASGRRQQCTGTPPIQSTPCGLSPKSGQLPLRIAPCTVSPKEIAAHMTCSHFVRILELLHCCMPASMRALHLKHSLTQTVAMCPSLPIGSSCGAPNAARLCAGAASGSRVRAAASAMLCAGATGITAGCAEATACKDAPRSRSGTSSRRAHRQGLN